MNEADQTTILIRSLQNAGAWARKYPDLQRLMAGARAFSQMRSLPPQPCDIECCYQGLGIHIEVKYMDGYKAFNSSVFARAGGRSQLDDLLAYEEAGGIGVVALVVWQSRQYSRLLLWRVGALLEAMGERGSIVKKDLMQVSYYDQEGTGNSKCWYLGAWLDAVTSSAQSWMPPLASSPEDEMGAELDAICAADEVLP